MGHSEDNAVHKISSKLWYWFNLKSFLEFRYKKDLDAILAQNIDSFKKEYLTEIC